jgi:diguanylate cyclase (GGDEF)-like protein
MLSEVEPSGVPLDSGYEGAKMWHQLLASGMGRRAIACALAYAAAAVLGIAFTREGGLIAVFWPANALLLGFLLRMSPRDYPATLAACLLAATAVNLGYSDPPSVAVARAAINMVEVLCAYHLITRFSPTFRLIDLRSVFILGAASMAAPAVSASVAAIVLSEHLGMPFAEMWWARWSRDAVGMLLFLPLIASFDPGPLKRLLSGQADRALLTEAAELATAFGLLVVVFALITGGHWYGSPTLFAPILLWTSLRFGIFPTAAAAVIIDLVAVMSAAYEAWPALFMAADTPEEIHSLQLFVLLVALPPLVVAVVVGERARARRQLDDALESMADAFALYDAQDRLVLCNPRYPEFLSRITDLLVPGVPYEDLVREGVRRGLYPGIGSAEAERWIAEQVAAHRTGVASEVQLADGRWLHAIARPTADGGTVDVRRDITQRKLLEEAIEHTAMHDALTNLPNRAMFYRELERALARAEREPCRVAVILVDLDRFKDVNDTFGHASGDQLLVKVAQCLVECVRTEDLVARLGGDEFAVIAVSRDASDGFAALARRIVHRLSEPVRIGAIEIEPGASLGMTVFPADSGSLDELIAHADRALYAAKQTGRGTWTLFDHRIAEGRSDSPRFGDDLGGALERGELDLEYQPIVGISSLEVIGFEALLRWNHPRRGRLAASSFIAAAERTPEVVPLTRFVLASALRQQRTWGERGLGDWPVWVNVPSRCLRWSRLSEMVARALSTSGVAPNRLVLEVTESSFVELERAEARIDALRRLGVRLAVDDFGTGYSSLGRLRTLPMDAVKIDRAFVAELGRNERDRAVVRAMVALGENLGLTPIAEGVETSVQLRELRRCGCVWAQGHLFSRPMPPQAVAPWLSAWEARRRLEPKDDLLMRDADGGRSS